MAQLTDRNLPSGFVAVRDILDGKFAVGSRVSLVGLVTDFRAPIPTKGTHWKCQIRFYDQSVEDGDDESLLLNIFWPESEMPDASCGDVLIILAAKVQRYRGESFSLCTHPATVLHVYEASKIPKPPRDASSALRPPNAKGAGQPPSRAQGEFVSVLNDSINKARLPSVSHFVSMKDMSVNVKNKSCELQDVRDGKFADIIAQIVRDPYDLCDKICLWISDYTENPSFFHFSYTGNDGQAGDPYDYGANFSDGSKKNEWSGPFGKRSMQVTCFDPHASVIRASGPSKGSWVQLRNVQIKWGHNGCNLEGYLREDRSAHGPKINVTRLDPMRDPEKISPLLKDAICRKRDYERSKKNQLKDITEAALAGQKRRADIGQDNEPKKRKKNNKKKKKRQGLDAIPGPLEEEQGGTPVSVPDINMQVKCENENKPPSLIADILELVHHETTIDGEVVKLTLPFVNANYRSNVHVVDFMPSKLVDFSRPRKVSEYDALSDHEPDSESEPETTPSAAVTDWEWRFYLQLEDAIVGPGQQKKRLWVLVDNQAAQCLVDLDASDLRRSHEDLEALRNRLFILWGELEEHKARAEKPAVSTTHNGPPDDSDDDERRAAKAPQTTANRPFSCCVRQYSVKVAEPDRRKADAGDGRRWQQMFGLFGTRVATA